jgi:hypothetical protein
MQLANRDQISLIGKPSLRALSTRPLTLAAVRSTQRGLFQATTHCRPLIFARKPTTISCRTDSKASPPDTAVVSSCSHYVTTSAHFFSVLCWSLLPLLVSRSQTPCFGRQGRGLANLHCHGTNSRRIAHYWHPHHGRTPSSL